MNLLIIGGTVFVGRSIAEEAVARGHSVTLFHRGTKGAGIVAGVDEIFGDRDGDLAELSGRRWDAVIDACGYVPRIVSKSGRALLSSVDRYVFISTISVYSEADDHSLYVDRKPPVEGEAITAETYGPLKVECEDALRELYGDRLTIVRPGLVAGAFDPTNRFTYWVERFAYCNDVLVPDQLDQPVQVIDARDLATLTLDLTENQVPGSHDAVGLLATFGDVIEACRSLRPETAVVRAPLATIDARPSVDLPLVLPADENHPGRYANQALFSIPPTGGRRTLEETVRWTYQWSLNRDRSVPDRQGLTRDREVELIAIARKRLRSES